MPPPNIETINGTPTATPHPHPGSATLYWHGCRCTNCRDANARKTRERRRRKIYQQQSDHDRLPAQPSVTLLLELHQAGANWAHIAAACNITPRDVWRLTTRNPTYIHRKVANKIHHGHQTLTADPSIIPTTAHTIDATPAKWMLQCLFARGWPLEYLRHTTNLSLMFLYQTRADTIHQTTMETVAHTYKTHRDEWGPNRVVAIRAWRRGHFPADCYDHNDSLFPDYRPIPGTLHPDLVLEAATPTRSHRPSPKLLTQLAAHGQYPTALCARTSFARWAELTGTPSEWEGPLCRNVKHDHTPPAVWLPVAHAEPGDR